MTWGPQRFRGLNSTSLFVGYAGAVEAGPPFSEKYNAQGRGVIPSLDDRNSSARRGPGGSRLEDACFAGEGFASAVLGINHLLTIPALHGRSKRGCPDPSRKGRGETG